MKVKAENILISLLKKYERSVLSRKGSTRNLHIRFDMEQKMKEYYHYENFKEARLLEEEAEFYESKGWITVRRNDGVIQYIDLNPDKAEEIYSFLNLKSVRSYETEVLSLMDAYEGKGIDPLLTEIRRRISEGKSIRGILPEEENAQKMVLQSLSAMMELKEDRLERVFSAEVLGNSKSFEKIRSYIIRILKEYFTAEEEEQEEDLLAQFHILRNPAHVIVKGHGSLRIGSSILELEDFREGLTVSSADISEVCDLNLSDDAVLTIENLTSFYQCQRKNTLMIYLGGYHNTVRREFLRKIYSRYPEKEYLHFGDIDAGGFYILEHLKEKTGIPFEPYLMSVKELKACASHCLPLSENDRRRLESLKQNSACSEVIEYMLEHNVKLEQEQIPL